MRSNSQLLMTEIIRYKTDNGIQSEETVNEYFAPIRKGWY